MMSRLKNRSRIVHLLVTAFTAWIAGAAAFFLFQPAWNTLDLALLDSAYRSAVADGSGPPDEGRVIQVHLSDETYAGLSSNTLDRAFLAEVNDALTELAPAAVMYDIIFSQPSGYLADSLFAESLYMIDMAYLPAALYLSTDPVPFRWQNTNFYELLRREAVTPAAETGRARPYYAERALPQYEYFAGAAAGTGHISAAPDADNVFRRLPMLVKADTAYIPAVSLQMFLDYMLIPSDSISVYWGEQILIPALERSYLQNDLVIPIDNEGCTFIPFYEKFYDKTSSIEAFDLLYYLQQPEYFDDLLNIFEGNFVFVGDVSSSISDRGTTTLEPLVPLVEIHSSMMNAYLAAWFYRDASSGALLFALFVLTLLLTVLSLFRSNTVFFLAGLFVLLLPLLFPGYALQMQLLVPGATMSLFTLWIYLLVSAYLVVGYIAERKELEEAHKQKLRELAEAERMQNLSVIGRQITSHLTIEGIAESAREKLATLMEYSHFMLGLYDEAEGKIVFRGVDNPPEPVPAAGDAAEPHPAAQCFREQRLIHIGGGNESRKELYAGLEGNASAALLPLLVKSRPVGIMSVMHAVPGYFTEMHINLLRNLAVYVAIALDNADAYGRIDSQKRDIEGKNTELEAQKKALTEEIIVRKRIQGELEKTTVEIKNLLDNAGEGYLSFGKDLRIDPEYSRICREIFLEDPAGQPLPPLLAPTDKAQQEFLTDIFTDILSTGDPGKAGLFLGLLPVDEELNGRNIHLAYKLIPDPEAPSETKMMVILTDITEKRMLQDQLELERNQLLMVIKAVTESNEFFDVINDFRNFSQQRLPSILEHTSEAALKVEELFREIHTFKGLFSQLDMNNAAAELHEIESQLASLRNNKDDIDEYDLEAVFAYVDPEMWLQNDLGVLTEYLGDSFFREGRLLRVDPALVTRLEQMMESLLSADEFAKLIPEVRKLRFRPLAGMLKNYREYTVRLAEKEGKLVAAPVIGGMELYVDPAKYAPVIKAMIHCFRNAVDHGIEPPEERLQAGKPSEGTILCEAAKAEDTVIITVRDDGRGIDTAKLLNVSVEKGYVTPEAAARMSRAEIYDLVFLDDVSTQDAAGELSGRGVGLSALKYQVEALGGTVTVTSEQGKGSAVTISVPDKDALFDAEAHTAAE